MSTCEGADDIEGRLAATDVAERVGPAKLEDGGRDIIVPSYTDESRVAGVFTEDVEALIWVEVAGPRS